MLSIRLSRTGKVHAPHYRIVVQEKRSKLNGKTVDIIGHYHPASKDKLLVIDHAKAQKWLGLGAQASDTVTNLLVKQGLLDKSKKVSNFFTVVTPEAKPVVEETKPTEAVVESEAMPEVAMEETEAEVAPEAEVAEPATEE